MVGTDGADACAEPFSGMAGRFALLLALRFAAPALACAGCDEVDSGVSAFRDARSAVVGACTAESAPVRGA